MSAAPQAMPTDQAPSTCPHVDAEQTPQFLKHGFLLTSRLRRQAGVPADAQTPVRTKALLKPITVLRGIEGVRAFYDSTVMRRHGAMPKFVQGPLFGEGAVHTLDGQEHQVRKTQMVEVAYTDQNVQKFADLVEAELGVMLDEIAAGRWSDVHTASALAYGRAAFAWAGVELDRNELDHRTLQLTQILDGFGNLGPEHLKARFNRWRLDRWYASLIEQVRNGSRTAAPGTALDAMAHLTDPDGNLVDAKTAGIELQNLTRPTIAVARFAAFAGTALVEHPEWVERIRRAAEARGGFTDVREAIAFAQEVRRVFPFVPMLPAFATKDTTIQGCPVGKGERVVIDILGTNTDPNHWPDAEAFNPQRFLDIEGLDTLADYEKLEAFIPQGGADVRTGHRCPGEKIAVTALSATVVALCQPGVQIAGSQEDLTFDWTKVLTRPDTGVRVIVRRS